jgi:2-polyprenyl-3-methyl-5-hydroxy-6-metoxy-1,4-benzoquinol methylase
MSNLNYLDKSSMTEIILTNCTICGFEHDPQDQFRHGYIQGNTTRFLKNRFKLWKCPNCMTVHSLNQVDFANIYQDYPVNVYQTLDFFASVRFSNLLKRLTKVGLKKNHKILDMGCGNGTFVSYLKKNGYSSVKGFDPYVKEFSDLNFDEKFDCVIVNDVIEHVENPRAFMGDCTKFLHSQGIIYFGTADSSDVELNEISKYSMKLHQPFHRVLMTPSSLEKLGSELINFTLMKAYKRSYMDTLIPFVNYRFLDEFNKLLGYEMDLAFKSESQKMILSKPKLLFFAFFGYFFPCAYEPAIILKKGT